MEATLRGRGGILGLTSLLYHSSLVIVAPLPHLSQAYEKAKQFGLRCYSEEDGSDEAALEARLATAERDAKMAARDRDNEEAAVRRAVQGALTAAEAFQKSRGERALPNTVAAAAAATATASPAPPQPGKGHPSGGASKGAREKPSAISREGQKTSAGVAEAHVSPKRTRGQLKE